MWSNRKDILPLLVLLSCGTLETALAAEPCVPRDGTLRYVDVFDGRPEELAHLVPDKANKSSGYWRLGYVYDAGRAVTIRCKYADGQASDIELTNRVSRCDYRIDNKQTLKISCQ
jgi:hypothetical protein